MRVPLCIDQWNIAFLFSDHLKLLRLSYLIYNVAFSCESLFAVLRSNREIFQNKYFSSQKKTYFFSHFLPD